MSYSIICPVCGKRDLGEFRFGNEDKGPIKDPGQLGHKAYVENVVMTTTAAGPQKEWWCHSYGCGSWFTIYRDTLTGRQTNENGEVI